MDTKWQHMVVELQTRGLVPIPWQAGVETPLDNVGTANTVQLLDELGALGWELVAVQESQWWLKKRVIDESQQGESFAFYR